MAVYTPEEEKCLLRIAREALAAAAMGHMPEPVDLDSVPPALRDRRACFVTIHTREGELRGCTGTLVARRPLAEEVRYTAVQTALQDPRFPPLRVAELEGLHVEISVLTPPVQRDFDSPDEIPTLLRPGVDGVILVIGGRRATFLPQVWERIPDPVEFLDLLCQKMGLFPGAWSQHDVQLYTYEAIVIEE